LIVDGASGLTGPNVRATMVKAGAQGQKHELVQHLGQLTAEKHVKGQAKSQFLVHRLLNVQVSKICIN